MRRIIAITVLALTLGACTPHQAIWWHFHDLGHETFEKAVRVAECESGLDPEAISPGGGNWGLFQVNTIHRRSGNFEASTGRPWEDVLHPYWNAMYARQLYDARGWQPWPICGRR